MALAGLWENWRSPAGEWVRSFAIVTTASELCAELHNRMPVVLGPEAWPSWLAEGRARTCAAECKSRRSALGVTFDDYEPGNSPLDGRTLGALSRSAPMDMVCVTHRWSKPDSNVGPLANQHRTVRSNIS